MAGLMEKWALKENPVILEFLVLKGLLVLKVKEETYGPF